MVAYFDQGFSFLIPFFSEGRVLEFEKGYFDYLGIMGLSSRDFFLSSFLVDWFLYVLNVIAALIVLSVSKFGAFANTSFLVWLLPMISFGPCMILLSYILAFAFRKQETCGMVVGFGTAIVVFVPYFVIDMIIKDQISPLAVYLIGFFLPTFALYESFSVAITHVANWSCIFCK
jgi:hypothetical protein